MPKAAHRPVELTQKQVGCPFSDQIQVSGTDKFALIGAPAHFTEHQNRGHALGGKNSQAYEFFWRGCF
jgi:hypothetical protein